MLGYLLVSRDGKEDILPAVSASRCDGGYIMTAVISGPAEQGKYPFAAMDYRRRVMDAWTSGEICYPKLRRGQASDLCFFVSDSYVTVTATSTMRAVPLMTMYSS